MYPFDPYLIHMNSHEQCSRQWHRENICTHTYNVQVYINTSVLPAVVQARDQPDPSGFVQKKRLLLLTPELYAMVGVTCPRLAEDSTVQFNGETPSGAHVPHSHVWLLTRLHCFWISFSGKERATESVNDLCLNYFVRLLKIGQDQDGRLRAASENGGGLQ